MLLTSKTDYQIKKYDCWVILGHFMLFSGFIVLGLAFLLYAGLFKVILCCFPNYILGCFLIYFERKVSIFRVRLMTSQIGVMTVKSLKLGSRRHD